MANVSDTNNITPKVETCVSNMKRTADEMDELLTYQSDFHSFSAAYRYKTLEDKNKEQENISRWVIEEKKAKASIWMIKEKKAKASIEVQDDKLNVISISDINRLIDDQRRQLDMIWINRMTEKPEASIEVQDDKLNVISISDINRLIDDQRRRLDMIWINKMTEKS